MTRADLPRDILPPMVTDDLPARAAALRRADAATLLEELEAFETRFIDREAELLAFVPEAGRFERLRREARELAARFPDPTTRPALFGLLVGVKDCLHVDGLPTRVGSRLPAETFRGPEGGALARLRAAGALVLGKTRSTEFTYFAPAETRNPHHPEHTPGGSSSGSAAAVGAKLCDLALGTQTIGSVIRPAAFCGVAGFKASFGRVPADGLVHLAPTLDHVGFFTSRVAGSSLVAPVLVDGWQTAIADRRPVLGIPEGPYLEAAEPLGLRHFRAALKHLETAGYDLRPVAAFDDFAAIRTHHDLIVAAEAAEVHREWFPRFEELYHDKTAELIRRGQEVDRAALASARAGCTALRRELQGLMDEHGLDLWITPAAPGPAPRGLGSTGDPVMNLPWTQAGLPSVGLPSGRNAEGLPLGLQLVARFGADEPLLAWASDLERISP